MTATAEPMVRDHVVTFYDRDDELVLLVAESLGGAIRAGGSGIAVATARHALEIEAALVDQGVDVQAASSRGTLTILDAADTLARISRDGALDAAAFQQVVGGVLRKAASFGGDVQAFGEMVALLWDAGAVPAALELETLWGSLQRELPFTLLCGYPASSIDGEDRAEAVTAVCHAHSHVIGEGHAAAVWPDPEGGPGERRDFAPTSGAPRAARRFVVETLQRWSRHACVDDAAVVVSELATNAVVHARSYFTVIVSEVHAAVRVSVRDASSAVPEVKAPRPDDVGGRGLVLVAGITSRWGVERGSSGKVVWAELADPGGERPGLPGLTSLGSMSSLPAVDGR